MGLSDIKIVKKLYHPFLTADIIFFFFKKSLISLFGVESVQVFNCLSLIVSKKCIYWGLD